MKTTRKNKKAVQQVKVKMGYNRAGKFRVAITFDEALFKYYSRMAKVRGDDFSPTVASVLAEIMRDDIAVEKADKNGTYLDGNQKLFERTGENLPALHPEDIVLGKTVKFH